MTDGRVFFFIPIFNILFTDSILGDDLTVHKDSLNVTVGQSVLLPASYSITSPINNWPSIEWVIRGHTIVYCSVTDGSLSAEGHPVRITGEAIISPKYRGRVDFFKLNASLLLKDLTEADTGTYTVRLLMDGNIYKGTIHLWVQHSLPPVGNDLIVHKGFLNVNAGQSILLPTTYVYSPPQHWPSIEWIIGGQTIVHCSVYNGSLSAEGRPVWVTNNIIISPEYQGRVELFPLNASLILKHLSVNDTGTYRVRLLMPGNIVEGTIYLWVESTPASFDSIVGDEMIVYEDSINVTAGKSVLFPTTYFILSPRQYWPSIRWVIRGHSIVYCSLLNGSISAEGRPLWVKEKTKIFTEYEGRVEFFPLNGSLLLKDPSVTDSGTYTVKLLTVGNTIRRTIHLRVQGSPAALEDDITQHRRTVIFILRMIGCFIVVVILCILILCCECR